jgi:hypothetical protein
MDTGGGMSKEWWCDFCRGFHHDRCSNPANPTVSLRAKLTAAESERDAALEQVAAMRATVTEWCRVHCEWSVNGACTWGEAERCPLCEWRQP